MKTACKTVLGKGAAAAGGNATEKAAAGKAGAGGGGGTKGGAAQDTPGDAAIQRQFWICPTCYEPCADMKVMKCPWPKCRAHRPPPEKDAAPVAAPTPLSKQIQLILKPEEEEEVGEAEEEEVKELL